MKCRGVLLRGFHTFMRYSLRCVPNNPHGQPPPRKSYSHFFNVVGHGVREDLTMNRRVAIDNDLWAVERNTEIQSSRQYYYYYIIIDAPNNLPCHGLEMPTPRISLFLCAHIQPLLVDSMNTRDCLLTNRADTIFGDPTNHPSKHLIEHLPI